MILLTGASVAEGSDVRPLDSDIPLSGVVLATLDTDGSESKMVPVGMVNVSTELGLSPGGKTDTPVERSVPDGPEAITEGTADIEVARIALTDLGATKSIFPLSSKSSICWSQLILSLRWGLSSPKLTAAVGAAASDAILALARRTGIV